MRVSGRSACSTLASVALLMLPILAQEANTEAPLTRILGIRVGHHTLATRPTGCTVVLMEAGAVAAVDIRGAAPGTRSTALLDPLNTVQEIHAVGDVVDPDTGQVLACVRTPDGARVSGARTLLQRSEPYQPLSGENTTIGIVATNASLTKNQLAIVARMAHYGLARAVRPSHTPSDGDTNFAIATGAIAGSISLLHLGALAADATVNAILRGVRAATGLPTYPSIGDLQGGVR